MIISKHTLSISFGIALIGLLGSACGPLGEHEHEDLGSDGELGETGEGGQDEGESGEGGADGHDEGLGRCEGDAEVGDGDGDGDLCEPLTVSLMAGQHIETGSVSVDDDGEALVVSIDTSAPYLLEQLHVYVGTAAVPTHAPGQFPYAIEFDEPTASYALALPLADFDVGCGDELVIAVHAVVVGFDEMGAQVFEETGWAQGSETFEGGWGSSFEFGICCEPEPTGKTLSTR